MNCGGCLGFKNKSNCIHVLEDQVMKEISLAKGLIWKIFNPKGVKTWEAKSGIVQSDLWLPSLDNHVQLYSCLGRPSAKRHNS